MGRSVSRFSVNRDGVILSRPTEIPYTTLTLSSTAQYASGGAGSFNTAIKWMRTWVALDAKSASATVNIVGTNNFAIPGVGLIGETQGGVTSPDRCRVIGFHDSKYASTSSLNYHVPCDDELGTIHVHDVWLDTVAGKIWHAINGRIVGPGIATTSTTCATTNALAINGRPSAPSTLGYGAMSIAGVQFSTTEPSASVVASAWSASPETAITGAVRHFCASDLGGSGSAAPASWACRISGAVTLTITGSPTIRTRPKPTLPVGLVQIFGDSIAAGRRNASSPYDSDGGWRDPAIAAVNARGRFMGAIGQNVSSDMLDVSTASPKDFDRRHQAVAGQALGVVVGATPAALTGMASALSTYGTSDTVTVLAFGINDLSTRIVTNGQTDTQARDAFLVDLGTACSTIRAARPSASIVIQNILRAGTGGSGITATVQSAIDLVNAALPSTVASLSATYGSVYLVDACTAVTPNQAAADNAAVLYDKIHETDASKLTHGAAMAAVLATV